MSSLQTAVALFIYNRPDLTQQLIDVLRKVKPEKILIVADWPDANDGAAVERASAARDTLKQIDWACQIEKNFAETHMGLGRRVSSGIEWVFELVEEAIFLEDDCLPDPSFFPFCQALLGKYRHEEGIAMICGTNPLGQWREDEQSYHFSYHGSHWGWAGWRRSWQDYDFQMQGWSEPETEKLLLEITQDANYTAYWLNLCRLVEQGRIDTWDIQWSLGKTLQKKVAAVPALNLVTNNGIGPGGTHTKSTLALSSSLARQTMPFPLIEPSKMIEDREYDKRIMAWRLGKPDLEFVLKQAQDQLASGRPFQALALVEAVLQSGNGKLAEERSRFVQVKVESLRALGRESQAARL